MEKIDFSKLKEWRSVVIIILLMVNGVLASQGLSTPLSEQAVIDLATGVIRAEIEAYMEQEINSRFYRLQKPYAAWVTLVGANYVLANGSSARIVDYDTNLTLVQEWAAGNFTAGTIYLDQMEWDDNVAIPADVIVEQAYNSVIVYKGGLVNLEANWLKLSGVNQTNWDVVPADFDYYINDNGTHHRVWDGGHDSMGVREDLTSTHLDEAIENCLDDDAGYINIKLGPECDGDGRNLIIERSRFTLYSGLTQEHQGEYKTPRISRIYLISDDDAEIRDVKIQGIGFQEFWFWANESSIQAVTIVECYMLLNDTLGGLFFNETDTLGNNDPFIDWIRVMSLSVHDKRSQATADQGCITFQNKDDGTGQIWIHYLKWHQTTVDDPTFMCFDTDSRVSPTIWIRDPSFSIFGNRSTLFKVKSGAYIESVICTGAWVEPKEKFTMVNISAGAKRFRLKMSESDWAIGLDCNITILDNNVVNYYDWHGTGYNGIFGDNNVISISSTWTGTFEIGTVNHNRRFNWQWGHYVKSWNATASQYYRMDHEYLSLSPHLTNDHLYDGITTVGYMAGEALYYNDLVYLNASGYLRGADADSVTTGPAIGIVVDTDTAAYTYCRILTQGYIQDYTWNFATRGDIAYTDTTAKGITLTAPSGSNDYVQALGYIYNADTIYFDPDYTLDVIP